VPVFINYSPAGAIGFIAAISMHSFERAVRLGWELQIAPASPELSKVRSFNVQLAQPFGIDAKQGGNVMPVTLQTVSVIRFSLNPLNRSRP
jgi:hypothetical protein